MESTKSLFKCGAASQESSNSMFGQVDQGGWDRASTLQDTPGRSGTRQHNDQHLHQGRIHGYQWDTTFDDDLTHRGPWR